MTFKHDRCYLESFLCSWWGLITIMTREEKPERNSERWRLRLAWFRLNHLKTFLVFTCSFNGSQSCLAIFPGIITSSSWAGGVLISSHHLTEAWWRRRGSRSPSKWETPQYSCAAAADIRYVYYTINNCKSIRNNSFPTAKFNQWFHESFLQDVC